MVYIIYYTHYLYSAINIFNIIFKFNDNFLYHFFNIMVILLVITNTYYTVSIIIDFL